jgi:hypothetical protein
MLEKTPAYVPRWHREHALLASWLTAFALIYLTGCASFTEPQPKLGGVTSPAPARDISYWWYVRFRLDWPEDQEPLWYPDLFIADRVIGPVLDAQQARISLWRFHRRAARDGAGRQFSFIFYTPPAVAREVNAQIAASPALARWQRNGVIAKIIYDDPAKPQRPGIGDTSDKSWSPQMQRAWPYFIMGVSRLWLQLIRAYDHAGDLPRSPKARYAAISNKIDTLWRDEGAHALLHHLSAVFGYQQIAIVRRELMRF